VVVSNRTETPAAGLPSAESRTWHVIGDLDMIDLEAGKCRRIIVNAAPTYTTE